MSFFSKLKNFFFKPPFEKQSLSNPTQISLDEIRTLIFREDFTEAKRILDRERKLDPQNPEVQFLHAHWLHLQKRFSQSQKILEKLTQTNPNPANLFELAQVLFAQDYFEKTETICHQLLKLDPNHHEGIFLLTKSLLTRIVGKDFDKDPLSPKSKTPKINLKSKYKDQVGLIDRLMETLPPLQKILETEPDNHKPLELLAEIFSATGDEHSLAQLLQNHPSRFIEGKIKYLEGKFDEAAKIFSELVKEDSQNARRLQNLALAEEENGNPKKALELFQKVLQLNPQSLTSRKHFQKLAIATNSQTALSQFEQTLKNNSKGELFAVFANILKERQDFTKALQFFAKAVDFGTKEKSTIHQFAKLTKDSLPPKEALKALEKLTKKFPEDKKLLDIFLEVKKTSLGKI